MTAAQAISAGHAFVIMLANGYPINVMNQVKAVPEVCTIFCATANPVEILLAITDRGRGIIGVVNGSPPSASKPMLTRQAGTACCAISGTSSEPPTRAGRARPATRRSFYARSLVRPALQDRLTAIGGVSPLFHRLRRLILQAHPGAGGGRCRTRLGSQTSVRGSLSSGAGSWCADCGAGVLTGFLLRLVLVRVGCRGSAGLEAWLGHTEVPCRRWSLAARVRVPVTRVFSLYVVQAGSACLRGAGRPAPTAFNRAGEKLRAAGGELPGVSSEADPQRDGGLALPLSGEEGRGHLDGCGTKRWSGCLRLVTESMLGGPAATAGSRLVSWTTME